MESLIHADIFFFISSVATIIFTLLASILLFYVIKAARNLYMLSESLKGSLKESEEFIVQLRERLEQNFLFRLFFPLSQKRRRTVVKDHTAENNK